MNCRFKALRETAFTSRVLSGSLSCHLPNPISISSTRASTASDLDRSFENIPLSPSINSVWVEYVAAHTGQGARITTRWNDNQILLVLPVIRYCYRNARRLKYDARTTLDERTANQASIVWLTRRNKCYRTFRG